MTNDIEEAAEILIRARSVKNPHLYADASLAAAKRLLSTVVEVAEKAGYQVKPDPDGNAGVFAIYPWVNAKSYVWLKPSSDGVLVGALAYLSSPQDHDHGSMATIEYDAVGDQWVGTEDAPRKRGAAAVIAQLIIDKMP